MNDPAREYLSISTEIVALRRYETNVLKAMVALPENSPERRQHLRLWGDASSDIRLLTRHREDALERLRAELKSGGQPAMGKELRPPTFEDINIMLAEAEAQERGEVAVPTQAEETARRLEELRAEHAKLAGVRGLASRYRGSAKKSPEM